MDLLDVSKFCFSRLDSCLVPLFRFAMLQVHAGFGICGDGAVQCASSTLGLDGTACSCPTLLRRLQDEPRGGIAMFPTWCVFSLLICWLWEVNKVRLIDYNSMKQFLGF